MPPIDPAIALSPSIAEPALPSDPALRTIAKDVLHELRYSFAMVAAEEQPVASGSLDVMFRDFLKTRSSSARTRYREHSRALLAAPAPLRTDNFGRYAALNIQEYATVGSDGLASRVGKLQVQSKAVKEGLARYRRHLAGPTISHANGSIPLFVNPQAGIEPHPEPEDPEPEEVDQDLSAGMAFKKLRLFIRNVHCFEETDEWGADHIHLGGTATNPDGSTSLIDEFDVSDDFEEGEDAYYGMNRVFATWDLATAPEGFPYVYGVVIAMAEKDDGGFYKFLKTLWEKVKAKVLAAIEEGVGAAIGAELGAALGSIAGAIAGLLIEWIISWFNNDDDIVGAKPATMTLATCTKSYYDWAKLTATEGSKDTLHFKGDGGHYTVDIAWKVFSQ